MVQMGLVQTDVPGAAHIAGAHRSRDGALYPGASSVLGLELGRSLAFTSPLQSLVVLPGPPDANAPPLVVLQELKEASGGGRGEKALGATAQFVGERRG